MMMQKMQLLLLLLPLPLLLYHYYYGNTRDYEQGRELFAQGHDQCRWLVAAAAAAAIC